MKTILRFLATGLAGLIWIFAGSWATAGQGANAEVVTLDAVLVEASAGTPWQIASLPDYVVLSRCPDRFNLAFARALNRAKRARLAVLPNNFWYALRTPMELILYDRAPKRSDRFQLSNPIDLSWSAENSAVIGSKAIQRAHPLTVGDGDLFLSCGNYWNVRDEITDLSVDPDSELRLNNRAPALPGWFLSGMEGPFGLDSHRVVVPSGVSDELILTSLVWRSSAETTALRNRAKKARRRKQAIVPPVLLPLGKLFSPGGTSSDTPLWNSEAALVVRWGLFKTEADGSGHRAGFLRFVDQASREPATEKLFKRCVGLTFAEAERQIGLYVFNAVDETLRLPLPPAPDDPVVFREATPSEIARIVGSWARLEAGTLGPLYFDFRQECLERADRLFHRERVKGNQDPSFLLEYGLYAAQAGDEAAARHALETALSAGVIRPRALAELARLRLTADLPTSPEGFGDLGEAEFKGILKLLSTARSAMPELPTPYNVWVQAMEHAPVKPSRQDLEGLREATERFAADTGFVYSVATLYRRCGYAADAVAIAQAALPFATTEKGRAQLGSVTTQ